MTNTDHTTKIQQLNQTLKFKPDYTVNADGTVTYAKTHRGMVQDTSILRQGEDGTWAAYTASGTLLPASQGGTSPEHSIQLLDDAQRGLRQRQAEQSRQEKAERNARLETARKARESATDGLATPRQVEYIMSLIAQEKNHDGGWFTGPTARKDVEQMTKAAASTYIDSMLNS